MTLTFLGTRGNVGVRSRRHLRHTATLVTYGSARILIDCGADWLGAIARLRPSAIVVTHAHPDHVDGLKCGAPCPVYAPEEAVAHMEHWPLRKAKPILPRQPLTISGVTFEAFPVDHSIRAPAVGYRITSGRQTIFYVPDVMGIRSSREALAGIALYVGDGATLTRPIVRRLNGVATGHTSIAEQLSWCACAHAPRAIFTHCGTAIVRGGGAIEQRVAHLGSANGVHARVAHDGLRIAIP